MSSPADMLFERAIVQREDARNQLCVALSALREIERSTDIPLYIAAIAEDAVAAVQLMQDKALDRSDAVPAETPEMAAPSVASAVQQTVDPVGIPSPPAVASSPRDPVDGSAGQPLFAQTKENV